MGINSDRAKAQQIKRDFANRAQQLKSMGQGGQGLNAVEQAQLAAQQANLELHKVQVVERAKKRQEQGRARSEKTMADIEKLRQRSAELKAKRMDEAEAAKAKAKAAQAKGGQNNNSQNEELPGGADFSKITPTQSISTNRPSVGDPRAPSFQPFGMAGGGIAAQVGPGGPQPGRPQDRGQASQGQAGGPGGGAPGGGMGAYGQGQPITNIRDQEELVTSNGITRSVPTRTVDYEDPRLHQLRSAEWLQGARQRDKENARADQRLALDTKVAEASIGNQLAGQYRAQAQLFLPEYQVAAFRALKDKDRNRLLQLEIATTNDMFEQRKLQKENDQLAYDNLKDQMHYRKLEYELNVRRLDLTEMDIQGKLGEHQRKVGYLGLIGQFTPDGEMTESQAITNLRWLVKDGMNKGNEALVQSSQHALWNHGWTTLVDEGGAFGGATTRQLSNDEIVYAAMTLENIPNPSTGSVTEEGKPAVSEADKRKAWDLLVSTGATVTGPKLPVGADGEDRGIDWSSPLGFDIELNSITSPANRRLMDYNRMLTAEYINTYRKYKVVPQYKASPLPTEEQAAKENPSLGARSAGRAIGETYLDTQRSISEAPGKLAEFYGDIYGGVGNMVGGFGEEVGGALLNSLGNPQKSGEDQAIKRLREKGQLP